MWILYNEEYWKNLANSCSKQGETVRKTRTKNNIEEVEPKVVQRTRKPRTKKVD